MPSLGISSLPSSFDYILEIEMKSAGTGGKSVELNEMQPGKSVKHRTSIFQVAKVKGFAKQKKEQASKVLTHIKKVGADGLQKSIQSAKTVLSKDQTDKHKLLLSPLTSFQFQLSVFFGYKTLQVVSADEVKLKIKRMLLDAETNAEAAALLVPVAEKKGEEKVMKQNWWTCCNMCTHSLLNPGIDFLFNRQQFYFVLISAYLLMFMSLIMLNYEAYGFPPPTCRSLTLDTYAKGRPGWTSADRNLHNDWSSTPRNLTMTEFSIIPTNINICASIPLLRGLDVFGLCRLFSLFTSELFDVITASLAFAFLSKYILFIFHICIPTIIHRHTKPNMMTNIYTNVYLCAQMVYAAIVNFGVCNTAGILDTTRSYNFTFNEKRKCRNCRKKSQMCKDFFLYSLLLLVIFFFANMQMSSCARGLGNNDCFLWNGTRITSKADAILYYKNYSYVRGSSLHAIREDSLKSAKALCKPKKSEADIELCITKQKKVIYGNKVFHALRPYAGLMKTSYEECYQFQTNGYSVIVFSFWVLFILLNIFLHVGVFVSRIEYFNPGWTASKRRKWHKWKKQFNIFFHQRFLCVRQQMQGVIEKIARGISSCFCPMKYKKRKSNDYDIPENTVERMPFAFPPIVVIGIFIVIVALVAAFMNYWIWYNAIVVESIVGCAVPALRLAYPTAIHPATTNTSVLFRTIFKPCHRFIDVVEVESEIRAGQQIFRDRFNKVANDLVSKASKQIIDKQINETQGEILNNDYVSKEEIASLMDLAKTQTEDSHPGFIDRVLTSTSTISGGPASGGLTELIIESIFSELGRRLDVHFLKVKSVLQNEILGKLVLGKIVPIILQVYAQFGNVILVLCVLLRARSISRMMNKLYVIGMKQKEVIERCFLHETGTYTSSITEEDLHALTNKKPSVKRHNNIELFGFGKVNMSHLDAAKELTEEQQEDKREKWLEYKHIQDIHYFLPSFVVSQILSSIIQFWVIWFSTSVIYFAVILWVVHKIVIVPNIANGADQAYTFRSFTSQQDIEEGLNNLYTVTSNIVSMFFFPFLVKGVVLKYYGKHFSTMKNGIRAPKRFMIINGIQMVLLVPVTSILMIFRFTAAMSRALYLLGDMDKPFGIFDKLTSGWNSVIELMRIRAEFREKSYHAARRIRESEPVATDDMKLDLDDGSEKVGLNAVGAEISAEKFRNSWHTLATRK